MSSLGAFDPVYLQHIADSLQTWIDWEQRDGPVNDDKHIMAPPTWPTVRQIKLWIETLETARSELKKDSQ